MRIICASTCTIFAIANFARCNGPFRVKFFFNFEEQKEGRIESNVRATHIALFKGKVIHEIELGITQNETAKKYKVS